MNALRRSFWTQKFSHRVRKAGRVLGGPFKGMAYVSSSVGSQYWPKVFGTYETELHGVIHELDKQGFAKVIDVGAAEGYYAVGLATRWPSASVSAFESEAEGREFIGQMARSNNVQDRIQILGHATPRALRKELQQADEGRVFCVMDVEGAERDLCDLQNVPELARSHVLVETHDFAVPGIHELLLGRLAKSHRIRSIDQRERSLSDFRHCIPLWQRLIYGKSLVYLVDEWRPPQCAWVYAEPLR